MRYDAASWAWEGGTNLIKTGISTTGGGQVLEGSSNTQTTAWQHVTMVWSSGNGLKLYIDGWLDTPRGVNSPSLGTTSELTKLIVGKGSKGEGDSAGWDGLIDEVRIYDYALSGGEVAFVAGRTEPFDQPF
jgi:hypothetical protein